jgi:hypothetical protein
MSSCIMSRAAQLMILLHLTLLAAGSSALQSATFVKGLLPRWTTTGVHATSHQLPAPTEAGYLSLPGAARLYFSYYESRTQPEDDPPIVLWLQVAIQSAGLGCCLSGMLLLCRHVSACHCCVRRVDQDVHRSSATSSRYPRSAAAMMGNIS